MDKRLAFTLMWLYALAVFIRLPYLHSVEIGSDNIGPALAAMEFWEQGWSSPPNPESDHWLWITSSPWLLVSNSLYGLFLCRFLVGALIAPLTAWTAYLLAPKQKFLAATLGGMAVALDSGLIETLVSGFRGYMAPEWIALSGLLMTFGLRGKPLAFAIALPALIIAAGHHPLAFGTVLGWVVLAIKLQFERKIIAYGLLFAFVIGLFRLFWMWHIAQCDDGGLACFQTIAMGSSESFTWYELINRSFYDRFVIELGCLSLVAFIGIAVAIKKPFSMWTIGMLLGVILLGLSISTFRPYHLRLVASPIAVVASIGLATLGRKGVFLGIIWIVGALVTNAQFEKPTGSLAAHDAMAVLLTEQEAGNESIWVEGAQAPNAPHIYPAAVVLSAWLRKSPLIFSSSPHEGRVVFFSFLPSESEKEHRWSMTEFETIDDARPWFIEQKLEGYQFGGGHDWAIRFHPSENVISNID